MADLTFLHLTDLHILADEAEELKGQRTAQKLRRAIREVAAMAVRPDFFVLSGDLVNSGEEAEYAALAPILEEMSDFGVPVLLGLGNHDRRVPFRKVLQDGKGGDEAQRHYYSVDVAGLRVIMLDSKVENEVYGELDRPQLDWLAQELRRPAPAGNLIVVHHPPVFSAVEPLNAHCLRNPAALARTIEGRSVHAVLSGHIHYAHVTRFGGTLSVSTAATAYLLDPGFQQEHRATGGWGYTIGSLRGGQFYANPLMMQGPEAG